MEMMAQSTPQPEGAINALILDDDEFDRRRLCRLGANSGLDLRMSSVGSVDAMRSSLDQDVFDVILLDYRLQSGTGIEALDFIKSHETNGNATTIMVSGLLQMEVAVEALKSGCADFLNKDVLTPEMFRDSIQAAMQKTAAMHSEMSKSVDMDRALYTLATTRLPALMADLLQSDKVRIALQTTISPVVREAVAGLLDEYDLPTNVLREPEVQTLLSHMGDEQQIRLND